MSKNHSTDHVRDSMNNGEGRVDSSSCRERQAFISKGLALSPLLFWKQDHNDIL